MRNVAKRVLGASLGALALTGLLILIQWLATGTDSPVRISPRGSFALSAVLQWAVCFGVLYWLVIKRFRAEDAGRLKREEAAQVEERFALVARGVVDGIWDWNCQTNALYASNRWHELLGYAPGDLQLDAAGWGGIIHPEDRPKVAAAVDDHLKHRVPYEIEYRMRTKSGEYRWFRVRGQAKWDVHGVPLRMAGSITDIMAAKVMADALKEQSERLKVATESGGVGIWDWDLVTDKLIWDDQMFRLYGVDQAHFSGTSQDWSTTVHPADMQRAWQEVQAALRGERPFNCAFRAVHPDGTIVHIRARASVRRDETGKAVRMVGTNWDITNKVETEAALQRSEEFVHKIIDMNPALIFVKDREGRFTLCNQATADFNLCRIEQMIGKTDAELSQDADEARAIRRDDLEVFETGREKFILEEKIINARGVACWLQTIKRPIFAPDGTVRHVLGIATDITILKEAEFRRAALLGVTRAMAEASTLEEAAASILQSVCSNLNWDFGAVWRVDDPQAPLQCVAIWPATLPAGQQFHEATRNTVFVTGVGMPGSVLATAESVWIPDFARRTDFPRASAAAQVGLHASIGFPIMLRGSVLGVIEFFSRAVREPDALTLEMFSSVGVQIGQFMERRRAELVLAASEALLRQFIQHTPAAIAMLDAQMRYLQASDRWIKDYHLDNRDIIGKSHYDVFPDLPPHWRAIHERALAGSIERCNEDPFPRQDGAIEWLQWEVRPWRNADGEIGGVIFFTQVITERKRAQQKIEQAVTELERSNRELEQFAYVASHDLQEPLRAVSGCVQILGNRYKGQLDPRADDLIQHAVDGAQRMQTLIHDLLSLSRVNLQGRQLVQVESLTAFEVCLKNLAAALSESGASISCGKLPSVWADPAQLAQLFQNLLGNAIKYRSTRPIEIFVSAVWEHDFWRFSVRDNGIGIEPQHFERIFGVFQRLHTRASYPGTGIGLAICKKIVERHGGKIWVESVFGEGCCFQFTLPRTDPRHRI